MNEGYTWALQTFLKPFLYKVCGDRVEIFRGLILCVQCNPGRPKRETEMLQRRFFGPNIV